MDFLTQIQVNKDQRAARLRYLRHSVPALTSMQQHIQVLPHESIYKPTQVRTRQLEAAVADFGYAVVKRTEPGETWSCYHTFGLTRKGLPELVMVTAVERRAIAQLFNSLTILIESEGLHLGEFAKHYLEPGRPIPAGNFELVELEPVITQAYLGSVFHAFDMYPRFVQVFSNNNMNQRLQRRFPFKM